MLLLLLLQLGIVIYPVVATWWTNCIINIAFWKQSTFETPACEARCKYETRKKKSKCQANGKCGWWSSCFWSIFRGGTLLGITWKNVEGFFFFSNFSFLSSNFSIIKPPWVKFQIPILHYFVKCSHTSSSYICRICMLLYYFYFTSSFISFLPYISRHKVSKYRIFISFTLISAICHNFV